MKLAEMTPVIRYIVTKGDADFTVGDHIYLDEKDNTIVCREEQGWLESEEWNTCTTVEVEPDHEWCEKFLKKWDDNRQAMEKRMAQALGKETADVKE